jgi:peptide/nickel transport system permease protein
LLWRLIGTRLILATLTLLLVSIIIFVGIEILPGDVASRVLGREATEAQKAIFRQQMHLDLPLYQRYFTWVGSALRGDFGHALTSDREVIAVIGPKLKNTLLLALFAFLLYIPLTLSLAIISAVKRNSLVDNLISGATLVGLSTPEFLLATVLLLLFAVRIPILPTISALEKAQTFGDYVRFMTLPAITLAVVTSVYAIRMLRDNLIEVLEADYIKMAELKGLSIWQVAWRHAMPNALLPTLNITALNLAYLIGGVVIVERVFVYPGLGNHLISSIQLLDIPVIEAIILIVSAIYILANLLADVAAILLTPRLRTG